jgi:hypothetical protein
MATVILSPDISTLSTCPAVPQAALFIYPVNEGEQALNLGDLGVHETSLPLPIEQPGNFSFTAAPTKLLRDTSATPC